MRSIAPRRDDTVSATHHWVVWTARSSASPDVSVHLTVLAKEETNIASPTDSRLIPTVGFDHGRLIREDDSGAPEAVSRD